jgi:hypothetical protein
MDSTESLDALRKAANDTTQEPADQIA